MGDGARVSSTEGGGLRNGGVRTNVLALECGGHTPYITMHTYVRTRPSHKQKWHSPAHGHDPMQSAGQTTHPHCHTTSVSHTHLVTPHMSPVTQCQTHLVPLYPVTKPHLSHMHVRTHTHTVLSQSNAVFLSRHSPCSLGRSCWQWRTSCEAPCLHLPASPSVLPPTTDTQDTQSDTAAEKQ